MTRYVVLTQLSGSGENVWKEAGFQEAHSSESAIRAFYLKGQSADVLKAVAIPAKSWKPTAIRTETQTKVILGEPKPDAA